MKKSTTLRTLLIAGLTLGTSAVFAHDHSTNGLVSGFTHPFMGLDHIIVMLAIGLWAASLNNQKAVVIVPAAFVGTMILACLLTVMGVSVPYIEQGIIASVFLLGVLLAISTRFSIGLCSVLVASFAFFHGAAHGIEMPAEVNSYLYILGFSGASIVLHAIGIFFNKLLPAKSSVLVNRISGVIITVIGVSMAIS